MFDVSPQLPPWLNPRETPFDSLLKGVQAGSMISNAMSQRTQLGMEIEKQQTMLPVEVAKSSLAVQQMKEMVPLQMEQLRLANDKSRLAADYGMQVNKAEGEIANILTTTTPDSPEYLKKLGDIGTRYPAVQSSPVWLHATENFYKSSKLATELTRLQGVADFNAQKFDLATQKLEIERLKNEKEKLPVDAQMANWVSDAREKLKVATESGDDSTASKIRESLDYVDAKASKGMKFSIDENGNPVFEVGGKPTPPAGSPTSATNSRNQQKLASYENTTELLSKLENNLTPGDVGAAGVAGEFLIDRTLAQIPGMASSASQGRIANRTALKIARESLMRQISDDTRFSNKDREDIGSALPENGVFESYPNALQRIQTVREILASRGKVYGSQMGMKVPPLWTMTPEEIKSAVESKAISLDQASEALRRFHGFK